MRILVVCTDADIGGAERFLASLASAARDEDTVGLVVLMRPGSLSELLEASFDEVHYLGFSPSSRNLLGMIRGLARTAKTFRPDIVSSHLFHADLVTSLAHIKAPKTMTVHTQGLGPADHPLTRLVARAVGLLSSRFDAVIPAGSSRQMANFIRSLRMKHVVDPIPNGAVVPEISAFDSTSRTLLSLARNHPVKGHTRLFEAFAAVAADAPEWTLLAHGPGVLPEDRAMREAIAAAGAEALLNEGRIRLAGPTNRPEFALAKSAALVISSIYGEAFPIVGAEAAGLGIPVITTNLGSCSEFADDPRFLVRPDDAKELADAIRDYTALDDKQRLELSRSARARAEREYHPSIAYERYRGLFSSLIARRRGGGNLPKARRHRRAASSAEGNREV